MGDEVNYIKALKILSPREIEILDLVGRGYTSKEIGRKLSISKHTVSKHRENIIIKLNLSGYRALVLWYRTESQKLIIK